MRIDGLKTDSSTRALVTIDYPHHEIHDGDLYEVAHYDATVANSAAISIATIVAIGYEAHFTLSGAAGGDALLELLEGGTVTGGDAVTVFNMNRTFDDMTSFAVTDATLAGSPTTLVAEYLPGGSKNKAAAISTGTRPGLEWITDADKIYAVRITNMSGGEVACSLAVNFYK